MQPALEVGKKPQIESENEEVINQQLDHLSPNRNDRNSLHKRVQSGSDGAMRNASISSRGNATEVKRRDPNALVETNVD